MKLQAVSMQKVEKKPSKLAPAKRGAIITTGMLAASSAITWAAYPNEMRSVVKECGGRNKYIANYALGLAIFAAGGALVNTALSAIMSKVKPKQPPKAAN